MYNANDENFLKEDMVICKNCGENVKSTSQFCNMCGQAILTENSIPTAKDDTDDSTLTTLEKLKLKLDSKNYIRNLSIAIALIFVMIVVSVVWIAPEMSYTNACKAFNNGGYGWAYPKFEKLGDYKDSEEKVTECIYKWADKILTDCNVGAAEKFSKTVELNETHYATIYSRILKQFDAHPQQFYWNGEYSKEFNSTYPILKMLPNSYEQTGDLVKLLEDFNKYDALFNYEEWSDYIRHNKYFLEKLWNISLVQNALTGDIFSASTFFEGHWTTGDGAYYITFDESGSKYNLPYISDPNADHYAILQLTYVLRDKNMKDIAKVFKFTMEDFNTMDVFCYKNNRTYRMYRH